jgi:TRAP-type C4-dicarboxylate transport system substrate-binding protein
VLRRCHCLWIIIVLLFATSGAVYAQAPARIRLGTLAPRGTSYHQILLQMAEKWRQGPHGGVTLTVYTDGTMGGEAEMVRRMRVGQLQAAMLTVPGLSEIDKSIAALQEMPMMFSTYEELEYVRAHMRADIEQRFLKNGFVVLFLGDSGWAHFFSRTPATHPADFKELKIFAWANDNHQIELMKAAGYQPVPLEFTDTLTGLQTGLIDAVPTVPVYALAGQYYGPLKHMLEVKWVPLVGGIVVTKKAWDALPADTRESSMRSAQEAGQLMQARSRQESIEATEAMRKLGVQVHPVPLELEREWRAMADQLYPKIRGTIVPAETFDAVRKLVAEYRENNAKGSKAK